MSLSPGTRVASYEVLSKLGEGGMGEVYRARDAKLGRDVALKILPDAFANDPERLSRFEREARTLASLNHANIAHVYDAGKAETGAFLAMELVEGEDLSTVINRKAGVPLNDALPIAHQIALALEAAHDAGIVHRDLKPANIKLRADATVKVLDFGLAKTTGSDRQASGATMTSPAMTQMGVILGTAAYMSPEQAAGKAVDKRSDLWAFGVVLLEMLTGRQTFHGETVSHVIASVLKDAPDLSALPADTPASIRRLLRRCLEKDRRKRIADAADARLEIEEAMSGAADAVGTIAAPLAAAPRWRRVLPWMVAAAAIVTLATVAAGQWRTGSPAAQPLVRLDVDFGVDLADPAAFAISPDGRHLAYVTRADGGVTSLITRALGEDKGTTLVANVVRGFGSAPFFSPDNQWVGFFAERKLKKVPIEGGAVSNVADAIAGGSASWSERNEIVTTLTFSGVLSRVPADGGQPQLIPGSAADAGASALPGGDAVLFYSRSLGGIAALRASGEAVLISQTPVTGLQYVPGYILYLDDAYTLGALPFDARRLASTGTPFALMEGVDAFSASMTGTLIVHRGSGGAMGPGDRRVLNWLDASGAMTPFVDQPEAYASPHPSPDGKRLLVTIFSDGRSNLWVRDLDRGSMSQLTFNQNVHSPRWLDSRTVLFTTAEGVHVLRADGSGKPRRILETALTLESVSPDGRRLAVTRRSDKTARDVFIVPLEGAGDAVTAGQPVPFLETAADEINPVFSPDGRWIAYATGDQGSEYAVYVRPASGAPGQWLVQGSGLGFKPVWAPSGNRLFFQLGTGELMTADYSVSGASFVVGAVKPFGSGRSLMRMGAAPTYFVLASGRVGTLAAPPQTPAGARRASHTIFLNFLDEIGRRAAKVSGK